MEKYYYFKNNEFDNEGFNKRSGVLFAELILDWEGDFHKEFPHLFANHLFANHTTMLLLKRCYVREKDEPEQDYGMELIDGKIDFDANLEIDKYSNRETLYAYSSELKGNEDEPVWLIVDDKMKDGVVIFKYIDEDDEEDKEIVNPEEPVKKSELIIV